MLICRVVGGTASPRISRVSPAWELTSSAKNVGLGTTESTTRRNQSSYGLAAQDAGHSLYVFVNHLRSSAFVSSGFWVEDGLVHHPKGSEFQGFRVQGLSHVKMALSTI